MFEKIALLWEKADARLLSFYTRVSHKFQRIFGKTNFFLAKLCFSIAAFSAMTDVVNYWFPVLHGKGDIFLTIVGMFVVLTFFYAVIFSDQAEEEAQTGSRTLPYITRILLKSSPIRLLFATGIWLEIGTVFTIPQINSYEILNRLYSLSLLSGIYFCLVTPLPPGTSKVAEWRESLAAAQKRLAHKQPL